MNIYKSERLLYIPVGDSKHEPFLHDLLTEAGALNFDTSIPAGVTQAQAQAVSKGIGSRKLLSMYICKPSVDIFREPGTPDRNPSPIGVVSLSRPEERLSQHGNAFLSVAMAGQWQRQGYGGEAIAWALDWAFGFARLHRVEASVYDWNPGARRLYNRLGFRDEGVRREAIWFMGAWHDLYEMAVLEHEWRAIAADIPRKTWAPQDGKPYSAEEIAKKMDSA